MNQSTISHAADLLIQARLNAVPLAMLPEDCRPGDEAAAYAIQAAHVMRLCERLGAKTIGYKIGATGEGARRLLNTDHPFYGRLLDKLTRSSPATLAAGENRMKVIEAEFAFRMAKPLPPRGTAWSVAEVKGAVDALIPAIEVVDSRYAEWTKVGILSVVADQGSHGHWIAGAPAGLGWRDIDLGRHQVRLEVDGKLVREGTGSAVMGDPLNALAWLANGLNAGGAALQAGDCISTGTAIDVYPAKPGEAIRADFGALGDVTLRFT